MKNLLFIILFFITLFISCSGSLSGVSEKDISINIDDNRRPNFITLSCNVAVDEKFDDIKWQMPSGEIIDSLKSFTAYFPQKGNYKVLIHFTKGDKKIVVTKNIAIESDDPYYTKGETLVWNDEFDGDTLNENWWFNETDIHVNDEWQVYTPGKNINISDGILTITARKEGEGQKYGDYTSGRLNTEGKKEFLYGRMEIRAKLPNGRGTWPAIWMLGKELRTIDWPACGEIDIMEHVGYDPKVINSALHTTSSWGATLNSGKTTIDTFDSDFHIYGLNWTADRLDFYVDSPDNIFYTYNPTVKNKDTWPFGEPFFFILNFAVGGGWGGKEGVDDTIFPRNMYVDYVRVFQKNNAL
jgi:beta-glucanase (GH16 family)